MCQATQKIKFIYLGRSMLGIYYTYITLPNICMFGVAIQGSQYIRSLKVLLILLGYDFFDHYIFCEIIQSCMTSKKSKYQPCIKYRVWYSFIKMSINFFFIIYIFLSPEKSYWALKILKVAKIFISSYLKKYIVVSLYQKDWYSSLDNNSSLFFFLENSYFTTVLVSKIQKAT